MSTPSDTNFSYKSKELDQDIVDAAISEGKLLTLSDLLQSLEELLKIEDYCTDLHTETCIISDLLLDYP